MTAMKRPTATVVKLKPETHARLQAIARQEDRPMGEVVTTLIEWYEQQQYWRQVQEDYRRLNEDPIALREYLGQETDWDITVVDDVPDEDRYYTKEEEQEILAKAAARTQGR